MKRLVVLSVFAVSVLYAAICEAADVQVVPGANGVFYIKAIDFVDITGVELELSYDTAALANPRITQGDVLASTMFVPNPTYKPNAVKIAAMSLSPLKSSGDLVVLTFDLKGSAPGTVGIRLKRLASSKGTPVSTASSSTSTDTSTSSPTSSASSTNATGTTSTGTTSGTSSSGTSTNLAGISMGTITLPQDQLATTDKKTEYQPLVTDLRKDMTLPLPGSDSTQGGGGKAAAAAAGKQTDQPSVAYKSVLQMFKEFKGEKSPKSLVALFASADYPDFKQDPPVIIADGVKPVRLTLRLKPSGNESPKFILQGANVQQLRGVGEDYVWVVDAVPKKGVSEAKLTAIDGQRILEFPLVVAPLIDTALAGGGKTTEADFTKYLTKPAKYDLNKDSKFDYVDDYIYTANYIVAMKIKPEKLVDKGTKEPAKVEKKEEKRKGEPAKIPETKPGAADKKDKLPGKGSDGKNGEREKDVKKKPAAKQDEKAEGKKGEKKPETPEPSVVK